MRYQVTLDDEHILYDSLDDTNMLFNPELDLTISKVGKFSFSIYSDHPHFNKLKRKNSKISAFKDGKTIYRGRPILDTQGLWNNKDITCESALAFLNDSIVRPGSFSGSPLDFLTMIIVNHNSQVSEEQKLKLGNVTVEDPNNYIARSWTDYINSWELLEKRGLELVGGYLVERYEEDGTYIDWLEDFNDTSTQVIEFGENIIDLFADNDASNTYSVVIPLGAEIENEDGTKTRLTVESVNDGKDYLVNEAALEAYGWIVAPVSETTFDDVTIASNLKTKGQNWLDNQGVMIKSELEITALDLEATDSDIESFFINEYVRIKSTNHNIDKIYLLSSITIPLQAPENTKITLGESSNTLTGIELGNKQNIDNAVTRVGKVEQDFEVNKERLDTLETNVNDGLKSIREEVQTNITAIEQNTDEIVMTALKDYTSKSEFEEYQKTVSTEFTQTAEDFTFNFNNLTSQINKVEGDTQQQFQEQQKYIRFEDGKIILGETGNELTLVQQKDRISFIQNNTEVAFFSNNKLTVTDGDFLNSLKIGNFAFKPRANGNLSLVYVGGDTVG